MARHAAAGEVRPAKQYLKETLGISGTIWKRIKHSGTFRHNDLLVNATRTEVRDGDTLSYDILRPSAIEPEDLPLDIRYEDDFLVIVNKPAGQLVHPTTKEAHGTLGNALLAWYARHGEQHAFHPVHRLDRDTSGSYSSPKSRRCSTSSRQAATAGRPSRANTSP